MERGMWYCDWEYKGNGHTPDLHEGVGHRLAGGNVEDLRVENELDSRLTITDIRADELASNI
jgi:hypothetical protein